MRMEMPFHKLLLVYYNYPNKYEIFSNNSIQKHVQSSIKRQER